MNQTFGAGATVLTPEQVKLMQQFILLEQEFYLAGLHLQQQIFARWHVKFAKVSSKFCQILNEPIQNGQSFLTMYQISPNLVTLKLIGFILYERKLVSVSCSIREIFFIGRDYRF